MGTCYAVISNHENSAFTAQVADTRVQSILGETIQQRHGCNIVCSVVSFI